MSKSNDLNDQLLRQEIFDERVIEIVEGWEERPQEIREISLESTSISNVALNKIVEFLLRPDCKIEKLNLSNNSNVADHGWQRFIEVMEKNNSLKELDISNNNITPLTAEKLSDALLKNKKSPLEQFFFFSDFGYVDELDRIADETTKKLVGRHSEIVPDKVLPIVFKWPAREGRDNSAPISTQSESSNKLNNDSPAKSVNQPNISSCSRNQSKELL